MKKIVLFDMDGTLTEPRKKMGWNMTGSLHKLQKAGFEIGILTGSDLDYIFQQCDPIFDLSAVNHVEIHYLPCNGTKYYRYANSKIESVYKNNMKKKLGQKKWRRLMQLLTSLQSSITRVHRNIPMTGNFISYRGSMVNWCPIGRQSDEQERKEWCEQGVSQNIRSNWLTIARTGLDNSNLEDVIIKMGGDTSFDIYPKGWDKTYGFKQFEGYEKIYFVGDRCGPNGNDKEAYQKAGDLGYITSGPEETIEIIKKIIRKESK